MRTASVWKQNASISMPAPAIVQAMSAPATPVAVPKRAGRKNTPAPTIEPMTMAVRTGRLTLPSCAVVTSTSPMERT